MRKYTDKDIIEGILKEDNDVLGFIYRKWYPMIERMIVNANGNAEDARDIFQDAMIVIFRKIKNEGLFLSCKFSTYLYAICRRLWLQEIKSPGIPTVGYDTTADMVCEPDPIDGLLDQNKVFNIVERHLNSLSGDCQKILRMHFDRADIKQISSELGYNSTHHTMDRKYRCKQSLIRRILRDPEFEQIRAEILRENKSIY